MWRIDTGGGRLNRQKRAERGHIGRKERRAYGTLGQENRRRHWSAEAGGLVAFRRTDDGGRTMWGIDTGGGRLNRQKPAERGHIGIKERGDGQDVTVGARIPDESWRGEKEGTK